MAIHTFDMARFISGADPVAVYCKEWNPSGSWYDHDASAIAIFEMTGGIVYTYRGSWCAEGLNTTWESRLASRLREGQRHLGRRRRLPGAGRRRDRRVLLEVRGSRGRRFPTNAKQAATRA